jgi:hypothetical protein
VTPTEQLAQRLLSPTLATEPKDQWEAVIEEYLWAARACIPSQAQPIAGWTQPGDGKLRGYAATLLLLCAIDAIGHCLLGAGTGSAKTRFDVLTLSDGPFGLPYRGLKKTSLIDKLAELYRAPLAHYGMMMPDVFLDEKQGPPAFCFENDELTVIQVPALYELVKRAWDQCNKARFKVPHTLMVKMMRRGPSASQGPLLSSVASGMPVAALMNMLLRELPSRSLLRITCDRCGKKWTVNEKSHAPWRDRPLRDILASMRHDGCGGEAGKAELVEGAGSHSVVLRA